MNDLRTAAQQALAFTMRDFASLRDFEAAKAVLHDNLRTALAQQAEPTRSQQMVAAGFKPRDRRLECDECGGKFTAQMLPIHKCAQRAEPVEPVQDQRCRAEPRSDGDFVCDCKIGECPGRSAEPAQEPVAWKQGNLVTFNEDPYPALGGLFVQFWDGEEVAARVYANDLETIRQRCAKVNTAPPQRKLVPLTEEEIKTAFHAARNAKLGASQDNSRHRLSVIEIARAVEKAVWEKNHG